MIHSYIAFRVIFWFGLDLIAFSARAISVRGGLDATDGNDEE